MPWQPHFTSHPEGTIFPIRAHHGGCLTRYCRCHTQQLPQLYPVKAQSCLRACHRTRRSDRLHLCAWRHSHGHGCTRTELQAEGAVSYARDGAVYAHDLPRRLLRKVTSRAAVARLLGAYLVTTAAQPSSTSRRPSSS